MAGHGKSRHLKRQNVPTVTRIARKGLWWVKKPIPGKHSMLMSIPLVLFLRERLSLAETSRQAKKLLTKGEILVDGVKARFLGTPVGLMDVVSIPKIGKNYRTVVSKSGLSQVEIGDEDAGVKYCRVNGKTNLGKKVQLNLHDSRNILVEKEEDRFKVGDTVLLSVPKQAVKGILKMEKGARCLVFKGRHAGTVAVLEEILERAGSKAAEARLNAGGTQFITLKEYLIVVDDEFKA